MKLKEIPRTATFAWLPDAAPQLVTGTAAGTIDPEFSAATALELWKLDLLDHSVAGFTAESAGRVETDARFHDLAVSDDGRFVAAALESGVVDVWKLPSLERAGHNEAAHSGPVRSVAWSRKEHQKFATGGSSGQVFVWDVAAMDSPQTPGNASTTRHDDVSSVAWNNHAAQILASAGNSGFTSIWDTRRRREVIHLHYTSAAGTRVPVSDVQWHPTNSTQLLTCSADDAEPVICLWDLRNVNSPEKVLRGHTKGALSADWCRQDASLLLSGGRDNQTLLWNPQEEKLLGAYPISVEWTFKTQFHPRMPDLFASSSFDGKITVQTLQDTHSGAAQTASAKSGDDFWESDNVMDAVHPSFQLQQAPKWLERPVSAKFGFGGKLAVVGKDGVKIIAGKDTVSDAGLAKELGASLKAKDFAAIASSSEAEGGWDLLSAVAQDKEVPLPEEPLPATPEDDDDDDFSIVPQYVPEGEFSLLDKANASVTQALLKGDYDGAVTKLVSAGQPADALLVASFGGPDLVKRAQNAYLSAHAAERPYLRAAWSVAGNHLSDLAEHSELAAWPSVVRSLSTSPQAITTLGSRLNAAGERDNALRVFLTGRNVAAAAGLWLDELPALEARIAKDESTTKYVAHVRALQQVVKKIVVASGKLGLPQADAPGADRLYSAFRDYANIASQQGDLELAKLFLDMLPEQYSAEKQRVNVATQQAAVASPAKQTTTGRARGAAYGQTAPSASTAAPQSPSRQAPASGAAASPGRSGVPLSAMASRAQASAAKPTGRRYVANPYIPASSPASPAAAPPTAGGSAAAQFTSPTATPPPPAAGAAAPGPPPRVGAKTGWNDVPELPESKPARRPTASQVAPPRSAIPGAAAAGPPPRASPSPRPSQAAVAPPPQVGAPKPSAAATAAAAVAPVTSLPPVAAAPPPAAAAARPAPPPNPYATKSAVRAGASSKPNPYAPSPTATPPLGSSSPSPLPSRPTSRSAAPPPPRARAAAVPPPPATSAAVPPPPPVAGTAPAPAPAPAPVPAAAPPSVATPPVAAPPRASASASPAAGRRSDPARIPAETQPIYAALTAELERIKPVIEAQYAKQYRDTARRLDILYEHLGNQDLLTQPTLAKLHSLTDSLSSRNYDDANTTALDIIANNSGETGEWMTGVKRLLQMGKAVPV